MKGFVPTLGPQVPSLESTELPRRQLRMTQLIASYRSYEYG